MLVKMYINAHYICAMCRNSKSVAKKVAIFSLFIETEPTLYLPNLDKYVTFIKGAEKNTIQVNVKELLHDVKDRVLSAEIHYNPHTTEIVSDIEDVKYFDIFTGKEIAKQ